METRRVGVGGRIEQGVGAGIVVAGHRRDRILPPPWGPSGGCVALVAGAAALAVGAGGAVRTVILPAASRCRSPGRYSSSSVACSTCGSTRSTTYEERDRVMARYSPTSLIVLPGRVGRAGDGRVHRRVLGPRRRPAPPGLRRCRARRCSPSASSAARHGVPTYGASFVEATIGLGLVALLISFLPTIYGAFQRRELLVARLATRAGDPPSSVEMILRHHRLARLDALDEIWDDWESWFADIEETHTSQPSLVFFRSISHERSWVTVGGRRARRRRAPGLDAAAAARTRRPSCCLRAGYLSLRRIADYFEIPFDPAPDPDDADLGDPRGVPRGLRGARRRGRAGAPEPRAVLARLRRLAGQLRRAAARPRRARRWRPTPSGRRTGRSAAAQPDDHQDGPTTTTANRRGEHGWRLTTRSSASRCSGSTTSRRPSSSSTEATPTTRSTTCWPASARRSTR